MNLNDCHIPFIFHLHLDKCIWNIDYSDIPSFLGIDDEQFVYQENTGTNDVTYCLRSALQLHKEHQQETYLLFLDLIKAFDTANHDLLFAILEKYGTPGALIDVIRHLHDNFQLKLVFDKKNQAIIDYTVGVQQGDNMAGLLFLFLMQAMDESFKKQCALPEPEF
jgi:hypothetical protein